MKGGFLPDILYNLFEKPAEKSLFNIGNKCRSTTLSEEISLGIVEKSNFARCSIIKLLNEKQASV